MNSTDNARLKTKRRSHRVLVQLVLILGLLALVWFSFGQNVLSLQKQGTIPSRVGALRLVEQSEGQEAVAAVSRLHGTDINLLDAYIATYTRDNESLTVWVGKAVSGTAATELMGKMVKGIGAGTSGFSDIRKLSVAQGYHDHEVYQVDGPGGEHYFYISKLSQDKVVWLTIQAKNASSILEIALDTF